MSNYRSHTAFNIIVALPALLISSYYLINPSLNILLGFSGSFIYSTLFMSPDLDLVHQIRVFSVRGFFTLPFRFYSRLFRHRGISHSLIFGSLTRILWLAGLALGISYLVFNMSLNIQTYWKFFQKHQSLLTAILAGICFADWCHLILDRKK